MLSMLGDCCLSQLDKLSLIEDGPLDGKHFLLKQARDFLKRTDFLLY